MYLLSFVTGRGTGVVVGTGTDTEFGVIFGMMQDVSLRAGDCMFLQIMSLTVRCSIRTGFRKTHTVTAEHGRACKATKYSIVRNHRCHLPDRRVAEEGLAGDVHDRR